ncbi:collagen alpha-4(IV) chain-like [Tachyglossus aculeatus]|uniref:collagen alpha-4(IV) chain-like n=1 Tax=Tachyglossus aculeatus TaxID=9261 RepID=UPI0018F4503D|nr:collagen alpha-4(IV) chain-like [Tachyglossus aculeatus]
MGWLGCRGGKGASRNPGDRGGAGWGCEGDEGGRKGGQAPSGKGRHRVAELGKEDEPEAEVRGASPEPGPPDVAAATAAPEGRGPGTHVRHGDARVCDVADAMVSGLAMAVGVLTALSLGLPGVPLWGWGCRRTGGGPV